MEEIEQIHEGFLGAVELAAHRHLLFPTSIYYKCNVCSKDRIENIKGFTCNQCKFYIHKECIEINIPYHRHPLKLHDRTIGYRMHYQCCICKEELVDMFYYCSRCVFEVCMSCVKKPILVIDRPKTHDHPLSLMPIDSISFICDACGFRDEGSYPCICVQCCFIVHKDCIDLPRVIRINRHDHRISHVNILSPEKWTCGVCHIDINNHYGAYSCSVCHYAVHSKCAIRDDVWDGIELEGKPDQEDGNIKTEDIAPFEVIDDQVIKHFSHEHSLIFFLQDVLVRDDNQRCYACILPFYYDACYICPDCDFILHETCANLPRIKRHELHKNLFTLYTPNPKNGESFFKCVACERPSNGFRYESGNVKLDVRCATISGEFRHGSHPESLFVLSLFLRICSACDQKVFGTLSSVKLDFFLCFKCATLPNEVFYKHDKHPLYLRFGGNHYHYGEYYWCEICEKPTYPNRWFYSCDKCSSTLHIDCVLGKSPYIKPGHVFTLSSRQFQVVSNNHVSRPFCTMCSLRCEDVFVIKSKNETDTSSCLCSVACLDSLVMSMQQIEL